MTRPLAVVIMLACLAGQAVAAGEQLDIQAKQRVGGPSCDGTATDVPLQLQLLDGTRWVLTLDGREYGGTYEVNDRQHRRLQLVADEASANALGSSLAPFVSALCSTPVPADSIVFRSFVVIRDKAGETARVELTARFDIAGSSTEGRFALTGEGAFGPLPGAVDLTKDADADGLPDELETAVAAATSIASGGDPNQLDDGEIEPFAAVIGDLADRLPLSTRTRENQLDILELTNELGNASPAKARRILRRIARDEQELRDDPKMEIVMESLDRMLGPATADDGTTAGFSGGRCFSGGRVPTGKPAFEQLQRGDVMLFRSEHAADYPWVVYYSHAGTYDGNNMVYEAVGSGVQLLPLQHWKEPRGTRVGLGRSNKSSPAQVVAALQQAESRYGTNKTTKYNFLFPNKTRDDAIYCSQLTWKIHKRLDVDLDSNAWEWFAQIGVKYPFLFKVLGQLAIETILKPAVAPDEVLYSPNVCWYSEGNN
jgi:hypothetical protein